MKKAITLAVFLACCAFAQQTIPVIQQQGGGTPPVGNCQYPAQVGNMWNTIGAGTPYICTQTGTTGPNGTFAWLPVPGAVVNNCGTANACSSTNVSTTSKIVFGITAALNGASPAIATVTAMPAFTSTTSYVCTANVNSASASTHVLAINYVSATSVTFTAANGATDLVSYVCVGS